MSIWLLAILACDSGNVQLTIAAGTGFRLEGSFLLSAGARAGNRATPRSRPLWRHNVAVNDRNGALLINAMDWLPKST